MAGLRPPPVELDTAELPPAAEKRLRDLARSAKLRDQSYGEANPDEVGYTLVVTEDDGTTHTVEFSLGSAPQSLRALVNELRALRATK